MEIADVGLYGSFLVGVICTSAGRGGVTLFCPAPLLDCTLHSDFWIWIWNGSKLRKMEVCLLVWFGLGRRHFWSPERVAALPERQVMVGKFTSRVLQYE